MTQLCNLVDVSHLYLRCLSNSGVFSPGKLLGSFLGKCSGSIRSIARHPELPVLASCGEQCCSVYFCKVYTSSSAMFYFLDLNLVCLYMYQ